MWIFAIWEVFDLNTEITLKDLLDLFIRRLKWIAIITAFAVIVSVFVTLVLITPKYTTTTSLVATSFTDRNNTNVSYNDLMASNYLVSTYIEVLKSDAVLGEVAEELGDEYSSSKIRSMIKAEGVGDTQVIKVSVEHTDPQVAMDIANAIAEVAPDVIVEKAKAGAVEVIDYALLPTSPSSPNLIVNVIIGFLLGIILSYAGFFIYEALDTIVRDEDMLVKAFDIPLLGTVPPLDEISNSSYGGAAK